MRNVRAIAGSAVFFLLAPGTVAGFVPWLLSHRYNLDLTDRPGFVPAGALLVLAGLPVLIHSFARFASEGLGTPAPVAPTERLVVGGIYRFIRNPMYVAVLAIVFGQALLFASGSILLYGAVCAVAMVSFVRLYEEPTLALRYGADYEAYRRSVPGWRPRLTPWRGGASA